MRHQAASKLRMYDVGSMIDMISYNMTGGAIRGSTTTDHHNFT